MAFKGFKGVCMADFDFTRQVYGRRKLVTNRRLTGDIKADMQVVKSILTDVMPVHKDNQRQETMLFEVFLNDERWWSKDKESRKDINNQIRIPTAWMLSRTLNGYCFGEPIKYIARSDDTKDKISKQEQVEKLSEMLDYMSNHDSDMMATMTASICGLGYKIALPSNSEELEDSGIPFVINTDIIMPMLAGVVRTNETISTEIMGFVIGAHYNDKGEKDGNQYTCWTKYAQYVFKDSTNAMKEEPYEIVPQLTKKGYVDYVPLINGRIPIVEVERNAFRKGDWEVALSLLALRNNLLSQRIDDIQQAVDYLLVLTNCRFDSDEEKKQIIRDRLLILKSIDPNNPQHVEILKNVLDQTSVQELASYIDLVIQETVGIPNRQERGGGGGDTGEAVKYRNGFRDLENNAGLIIPKMDKAEIKFLGLCLSYCKNIKVDGIDNLKASDIRCKFLRSYNDDPVACSQAFINYVNGGMDYVNALLWSKTGTDATEIANKIQHSFEIKNNYLSLVAEINKTVAEKETTDTTENLSDSEGLVIDKENSEVVEEYKQGENAQA